MLGTLLKELLRGRRAGQAAPAPAAPEAIGESLSYQRGGTVLAFLPRSEGDALKQITLDMLAPLRPLCTDIVALDGTDPQFLREFTAVAQRPFWFAMGPFGVGEFLFRQHGTPSIWLQAGIPFVRVFGDTPAYYPNAHVQHLPNSINAYGSREHWNFFLRCFTPKAPCLLQPHYPFGSIAKEAVDLRRKTAGGVIFPKNGNPPDPLVEYWRDCLPPAIGAALEAIAEDACAALDEPIDLLGALERHFAALGVALPEWHRLTFFLVSQLDDYLRRVKSTLIARSLLDYPVTISGVNWGHVDFAGRRARHDPDSDYARTGRLLDQCLAVIDMSPNTHLGPHDRALRAAGRYTAFLTNRQQYYRDNFANHRDFTFLFNADAVRECVERALSRPAETVEMGLAQGERLRQLRTPEEFVRELVTAVDACALACGERPPQTQNFVHYQPLPP
jgi:hypothetical protein